MLIGSECPRSYLIADISLLKSICD